MNDRQRLDDLQILMAMEDCGGSRVLAARQMRMSQRKFNARLRQARRRQRRLPRQ